MKQIVLTGFLLFSGLLLFSCRKNVSSASYAGSDVAGRWSLIYDSTYTGVGAGNHPVNYTGEAGDYFDFGADSMLYTKEGSVLDTLTYYFTSDHTAIISAFGITINGVPDTCQITNADGSRLTIIAPNLITPGGQFGRKVGLRR